VRRRTASFARGATPAQLSTARQTASLLLGYPDDSLAARIPLLRAAVASLPSELAGPLGRFLDHLETTPLDQLQADYVETFDLRRRSCLYLTYFIYGDTRKRGMALLQFKHLYARAGLVLDDAELPDHLAVVLEFTALGDPDRGERLLAQHRPGLETIRLALQERDSPYALVLQAVSATLPPVQAADREAVLRLARQGPPTEEVGLEPYGATPFAPPDYMPPSPLPVPLTSRPSPGAMP
jgi:nitrate reductase delta subunit